MLIHLRICPLHTTTGYLFAKYRDGQVITRSKEQEKNPKVRACVGVGVGVCLNCMLKYTHTPPYMCAMYPYTVLYPFLLTNIYTHTRRIKGDA
jgi:hypothetical protein